MSETAHQEKSPSFRLYGRRKGKRLRPGRQALLDSTLDTIRIDLDDLQAPISQDIIFDTKKRALWLEIGFGGGEHLAAQASAQPDIGFIGAEIFENGIASLLRHCDEQGLSNVRIFDEDVRQLLPALEAGSIERVFLLFPDPWPKRRHAKRRFICPEALTELARIMAPGAELRIGTDDPVYAHWCLRHGPSHPDFHWQISTPADWRRRPPDGVPTRYEEKALRDGRPPVFFTFVRAIASQAKTKT